MLNSMLDVRCSKIRKMGEDAERMGGVPHSQKRQAENSERGGHRMDGSGSSGVQQRQAEVKGEDADGGS